MRSTPQTPRCCCQLLRGSARGQEHTLFACQLACGPVLFSALGGPRHIDYRHRRAGPVRCRTRNVHRVRLPLRNRGNICERASDGAIFSRYHVHLKAIARSLRNHPGNVLSDTESIEVHGTITATFVRVFRFPLAPDPEAKPVGLPLKVPLPPEVLNTTCSELLEACAKAACATHSMSAAPANSRLALEMIRHMCYPSFLTRIFNFNSRNFAKRSPVTGFCVFPSLAHKGIWR